MRFWPLFERPLKPGTMLAGGRFHIHRFIGKGSYGLTYIAKDCNTGTDVVIKQLRRRKRHKPAEVAYFMQEADFLRRFHHPSIPSLLAVFQEKEIPFLAMDFVDAPNFEELIFSHHHTYTERDSFLLLTKVLHVIEYVHSLGIVHRDLRIPNILWDGTTISIIDFGLARSLNAPASPMRRRKKEHPLFRELSVRSDFFALGHFVLFLLYSSFEPSSKKEKSWEEELTLSPAAKHIIRRMLQLDHPYASVAELKQDILTLLND